MADQWEDDRDACMPCKECMHWGLFQKFDFGERGTPAAADAWLHHQRVWQVRLDRDMLEVAR
jgi:hypothetical protein